MSQLNLAGKITDIDLSNYSFKIQLAFVDEDIMRGLEQIFESYKSKLYRMSITVGKRKLRSYEQLKLWFVQISAILHHYQVPVTPSNVLATHAFLKENVFEVERLDLGGNTIYAPPSLKTISADQLKDGISRVREVYSDVDFEKRI